MPADNTTIHQHGEAILRAIDEAATSEGLRYYLAYGTLLGAVRHGGFIPWDGDVDVYVPVDDYAALLDALSKTLPKGYKTFNVGDPGYTKLFARVGIEGQSHYEAHVDLFPLAGAPAGNLGGTVFGWASRMLYTGYFVKKLDVWENYADRPKKRRAARALKIISAPIPARLFVKAHGYLATMYPLATADKVRNVCGSYGQRENIPKAMIGDGERIKFGSLELMGPSHPHEYLTRMYGDYMTPRTQDYVATKSQFRV